MRKYSTYLIWFFIVITITSLIVGVLYSHKSIANYQCLTCHSEKYTKQFRFEIWKRSIAISNPVIEKTSSTHVYRDYLQTKHIHNWKLARQDDDGLSFSRGIRFGTKKKKNLFIDSYEKNPQFREFIKNKIQKNELEIEQIFGFIAMPNKIDVTTEKHRKMHQYVRDLVKKSRG
ncbi:hypothetical protein [Candidatus Uabimicrobium sp. HlEnr_7]|uniref:hypothetical protein n=1 Tax=Candidatus Uabimicrobium helgolandensis TaxID=3095367 RepID=UPI003558F754